jgi:hypothetical protein
MVLTSGVDAMARAGDREQVYMLAHRHELDDR